MRIEQPIALSGFFWLPDEPDFRVPGDLYISGSCEPSVKVRLVEISSGWREVINATTSGSDPGSARILGISEGMGQYTLDDCWVKSLRGLGSGLTELTLIARFAFSGCHYDPREEVQFDEFSFSVEGLDEWLAVSGIDVNFDFKNQKSVIDVSVPEEISLGLPEGVKLKFRFGVTFPAVTRTITEAKVTQKAYACIASAELKPLEYFTSLATKLRNFLRLAMGQPVSVDSATGYSAELTRATGDGGQTKVPIQVYYREAGASDQEQEAPWFRMLFFYTDLEEQLEEKLAEWLHNYNDFGPALDVYFTTMANTSQYVEVEFLQRVQGLETLHRRSSQETEMPENEFVSILSSLLLECPSGRQEWLKGRLRYANELSLRKRLSAMTEPFEQFFEGQRKQKDFIDKAVVTRNYLTHYDARLETRAAKGQDLWKLTKGLEVLFQLHLLQFIGFNSDSVDQFLQRPSHLRQLMTSAGMRLPKARGQDDIPQ